TASQERRDDRRSLRSRGLAAVQIFAGRKGEGDRLLLAIARAALRRSGRTGGVGGARLRGRPGQQECATEEGQSQSQSQDQDQSQDGQASETCAPRKGGPLQAFDQASNRTQPYQETAGAPLKRPCGTFRLG